MKNAFLETDVEFLKKVEKILKKKETFVRAGTTVVAVIVKRDEIYCCNLGDSSAVMSRAGHAVVISKEHRLTQKKVCHLASTLRILMI